MSRTSDFCEWLRMACEDWSLGYDQSNRDDIRDNGECDCSSLVIGGLRHAGYDIHATYTGDMAPELRRLGFREHEWDVDLAYPGVILLNEEHHVCAVVSGTGRDAFIGQASIDENGRATGGYPGDQTGRETNVSRIYEYWDGWDSMWFPPDSEVTAPVLDVTGVLREADIREWQRQMCTPVDGVVSGQLIAYRDAFPALRAIEWDGGGSQLMRAVQRKVGVPGPTGVGAFGTVAMLQGFLYLKGYDCGSDVAGVLDTGTASAIQQSINDRLWCA